MPDKCQKFYKNSKIIIVSRDPKAIYWSMKRRNSLSYPGHDLKLFVKWYLEIKKRQNIIKNKNIIYLNYGNFFINFEGQKNNLLKKLKLNLNIKDNFIFNYILSFLYF